MKPYRQEAFAKSMNELRMPAKDKLKSDAVTQILHD
jgi:hypothetical protein